MEEATKDMKKRRRVRPRNAKTLSQTKGSKRLTKSPAEAADLEDSSEDQLLTQMEAGLSKPEVFERFKRELANSTQLVGVGDLSAIAEKSWVKLAVGDSPLFVASLQLTLARLKSDLGGAKPTPLERLLIEDISVAWLQLHYEDIVCAQQYGEVSRERGEYIQRRQERAHRRYISALRALAQLRRIPVPLVQINVAQNQVVPHEARPTVTDTVDAEVVQK
jgi:hypothetical protein